MKLLISYFYSSLSRKPRQWGLPVSLSVEPTTACNLGCTQCPSGLKKFSRPTGNLKLAFHEKLLDEIKDTVMYMTLYFQGEPFIHPQFLELVRMANRRGIFTATSTNGHFITPEKAEEIVSSGLNRLIFSVDGTTQATYERYRVNGSLEKVKQGIELVQAEKKKRGSKWPYTEVQFIVFRHNEHEIPEIQSWARSWGVDKLSLKSAQIYDQDDVRELVPGEGAYARYAIDETTGQYYIKSKLPNKCWRMWHGAVVTWDGRVAPCCFDKDAQYEMGNLENSSFREVWYGEKYQTFRNRLFTSRKSIDICGNCTEGLAVG